MGPVRSKGRECWWVEEQGQGVLVGPVRSKGRECWGEVIPPLGLAVLSRKPSIPSRVTSQFITNVMVC